MTATPDQDDQFFRTLANPDMVEAMAQQYSLLTMQRLIPPPNGVLKGSRYFLLNPHRSDEHIGPFSINLQTSVWKDFGCEGVAGLGFISIAAYLLGIDKHNAYRLLKAWFNLAPDPNLPDIDGSPFTEQALKSSAEMQDSISRTATQVKWQSLPIDSEALKTLHLSYPLYFAERNPDLVFQYRDIEGVLWQVELRWESASGKIIRPAIFGKPLGTFVGNVDAIPPLWIARWSGSFPMLGSHLLKDNDKPVLIVEGGKTRAAGKKIFDDYVVCSVPGGMLARSDLSAVRGKKVIVWPDNDQPGSKLAASIREKCLYHGAVSVAIVQ